MAHILYNEKSQNLPTEKWSILVDLLRNRPDRILSASFGIPKLPDRNVVSGRSYQLILPKMADNFLSWGTIVWCELLNFPIEMLSLVAPTNLFLGRGAKKR